MHTLRECGITITAKAMRKQMRDMARAYNLSRPRGVSLKRSSPQLSRDKLGVMRVIARMNYIYRVVKEAERIGEDGYVARLLKRSIDLHEANEERK